MAQCGPRMKPTELEILLSASELCGGRVESCSNHAKYSIRSRACLKDLSDVSEEPEDYESQKQKKQAFVSDFRTLLL
jgi:hypothetical protein